MRFGFHISIAGGLRHVVSRALERKCETIQIFSRNPRGWKYSPLDENDTALFKQEARKHGIRPIFVHMPYLANLASPEAGLFRRSVSSLVEDLKRSSLVGAPFLILHVGSAPNQEKGLERMARGINQALAQVANETKLLLENTAGSGHELGHDFSQLRTIIDRVDQRKRIGIVLDTAHAFAAGYDLRTASRVSRCLSEFDRVIGLHRLFLVHLNDSKFDCGSRRDRHWHIAQGMIGHGMYHILHHAALQYLPFIMETPRTNSEEDLMNMKTVRQLIVARKRIKGGNTARSRHRH
jgi:deoxyribonuclease-4